MRTPTDNLIIKKIEQAIGAESPGPNSERIAIQLVAQDLGLTEDRIERAWKAREGVPSPASN